MPRRRPPQARGSATDFSPSSTPKLRYSFFSGSAMTAKGRSPWKGRMVSAFEWNTAISTIPAATSSSWRVATLRRCRLQMGQPAKRRNCRCVRRAEAAGSPMGSPRSVWSVVVGIRSPGFRRGMLFWVLASRGPGRASRGLVGPVGFSWAGRASGVLVGPVGPVGLSRSWSGPVGQGYAGVSRRFRRGALDGSRGRVPGGSA